MRTRADVETKYPQYPTVTTKLGFYFYHPAFSGWACFVEDASGEIIYSIYTDYEPWYEHDPRKTKEEQS